MSKPFSQQIAILMSSLVFASIQSGASFAISPIQADNNGSGSEAPVSQVGSTNSDSDRLSMQIRILLARSRTLFDMGHYQDALISANKILEINSDYALAWELRGDSLHKLQQYNEALTAYDRALALLEGKPEIVDIIASLWTERARVLEKLNRDQESVTSYNKALQLRCVERLSYPETPVPAICSKYIKVEPSGEVKPNNSGQIQVPPKKQRESLW